MERGAALLRKKREALVAEFFARARPAADARARILAQRGRAYPPLLRALAAHGHAELRALGWPARTATVRVEPGQVWGVPLALLSPTAPLRRTLEARGAEPGATGPAAAEAARAFETLAELLLEAAAHEQRVRRIGEALARTSRQVGTLERRVAPALRAEIEAVRRTLEEREREEHLRLRQLARRRARR